MLATSWCVKLLSETTEAHQPIRWEIEMTTFNEFLNGWRDDAMRAIRPRAEVIRDNITTIHHAWAYAHDTRSDMPKVEEHDEEGERDAEEWNRHIANMRSPWRYI